MKRVFEVTLVAILTLAIAFGIFGMVSAVSGISMVMLLATHIAVRVGFALAALVLGALTP